jgi:serine/threonine protein kinase
MGKWSDKVKAIFLEAIEEHAPERWPAFLEQACAGDIFLRAEIEKLLSAQEAMGSFEEARRPTLPATVDHPIRERAGTVIAAYKLLQQIGEGGMGVVYKAEQLKPIHRLVALKIIKPGLDTAGVIARFEAERQALALMDHPNIARVLDAGATDSGRPYFVMELVEGGRITDFCDRNRLVPKARLKLFLDVCHAIQHAHHKGIIHRDIKPSNVLVMLHDGAPMVKVIDFGIAKALVQKLTEPTLFTSHGQMVGTPAYMSPEQAAMSGLDIDMRSDVYALGVLLYELLTGTTPLEDRQLCESDYAELLRLIREEEAPRPSTRLAALGDSAVPLAGNRGLDVKRLTRLLSGDLDLVVMKALEKDRNRRYSTPGLLADDLDRYLRGEAILARSPSTVYKVKKLAWRHRTAVLVGCAVTAALLVGAAVAAWQAVAATQAKHQTLAALAAERRAKESAQAEAAKARAVLEFVEDHVLAAARPEGLAGGLGGEVTLRRAVEAALPFVGQKFRDQPLIEARLRMTLGTSFWYLGDGQPAAEQYTAARTLYARHCGRAHHDTLRSMMGLANSYYALGRFTDALTLCEETLALQRARLGPDHPDTLTSMNNLANIHIRLRRHADGLNLHEETLRLRRTTLGPDHPDTLTSMNNLGNSYHALGRHTDALKLYQETLRLRRTTLGPDHPDTLKSMNSLAVGYYVLGRHADALKLYEETLVLQKAKTGPDHPDTLQTMFNLAISYATLGRHVEALRLREETLALHEAKLGREHPRTLMCSNNVAWSYTALGRHADAVKLYEKTLARQKARLGPNHPDTLSSMWGLAASLVKLGRSATALPVIDECMRRAAATTVEPELLPNLIELRMRHFETARDAAGCRQTAEMWETLKRSDIDSLYKAACLRAVSAAVFRAAGTSAASAQQADAEADLALAWLKQAVAAGYKDAAHVKQDGDLAALRDRADFTKLVTMLQARSPGQGR